MKPIIFSGDNPALILQKTKTQTRRVLSLRSKKLRDEGHAVNPVDVLPMPDGKSWIALTKQDPNQGLVISCVYGTPGSSLYVKESAQLQSSDEQSWFNLSYRSDEEQIQYYKWPVPSPYKYYRKVVPAMFMPAWASRISLRILRIRCERVQDISTEDILAEGIRIPASINESGKIAAGFILGAKPLPLTHYLPERKMNLTEHNPKFQWSADEVLRAYFAHEWDKLNYKRGFSWDSNPWVWTIDFEVI